MHTPLNSAPLHAQNPTTRFADRAGDYVKFRPTYPDVAIDAILAGPGAGHMPVETASMLIADVGAGTGIASRLLADRGARVLAVEPNAAMVRAAQPHPRVTFVHGTAEATTLGPASVDIVACAQAFHWFRPRESLAEFVRILRPTGCLALIWNIRDEADPLTRAYTAAIREAIGSEPAEMRGFDAGDFSSVGFTPPVLRAFAHSQQLEAEGFVGRAASASYVPKVGPVHDSLVAELLRVHARHQKNGMVTMRYQTSVYLSRPA